MAAVLRWPQRGAAPAACRPCVSVAIGRSMAASCKSRQLAYARRQPAGRLLVQQARHHRRPARTGARAMSAFGSSSAISALAPPYSLFVQRPHEAARQPVADRIRRWRGRSSSSRSSGGTRRAAGGPPAPRASSTASARWRQAPMNSGAVVERHAVHARPRRSRAPSAASVVADLAGARAQVEAAVAEQRAPARPPAGGCWRSPAGRRPDSTTRGCSPARARRPSVGTAPSTRAGSDVGRAAACCARCGSAPVMVQPILPRSSPPRCSAPGCRSAAAAASASSRVVGRLQLAGGAD